MNTELSQERLKELLTYDPDTGEFVWKVRVGNVPAGAKAGYMKRGYRQIKVDGTKYPAHRLAWMYVFGDWPKKVVDHIDRNPANNRISNLRDTSHTINSLNRSGSHLCATRNGKGWQAQIAIFGETVYLGQFRTREEASEVFKQVHRDLYWEHSRYWHERPNEGGVS